MQSALKLTTRVLPGKRIEFVAPELHEGDEVDVILVLPEPIALPEADEQTASRRYVPMVELVETIPSGPRLFESWADYDRFLQEEKDAWDR
jgi:hypothetical protein